MKTTLDIADELFLRSKTLARQRGLTLRTLIKQGLHASLERHERQDPSYPEKRRQSSSGLA
jgi:hypothetical protein